MAGGFIGRDYLVYISSVLSHAPGIFSLVVTDSASVATAVDLVAGQSATMAGAADGLVWSYTGSGAAFLIGAVQNMQQLRDLNIISYFFALHFQSNFTEALLHFSFDK